jgi:GGDEF domain-containing protein
VREAVLNSGIGNGNILITASVGSAHWPADGPEKASLVEAADAALYRVKRLRKGPERWTRAS